MEGSMTDRGAVERSNPDAFWCSICEQPRSKKRDDMLQVATRDGAQLHSVCRRHIPKDHHEGRVDTAVHPVFHETAKDDGGNPVVVGKDEHDVEHNADGVIRTLVYEDLLK